MLNLYEVYGRKDELLVLKITIKLLLEIPKEDDMHTIISKKHRGKSWTV
jgi:hypothetical protein